jgi:nondiscriminating glutamyl-tRNA synthetase
VTPSPAVFDFDKLNWLNRHYIKLADPERIAKLAERQFLLQRPDIFPLWTTTEFYSAEAMAVLKSLDPPIELNFPSIELINQRKAWFDRLLALFLPAVDHLDELPAKTSPIFLFDPGAAQRDPENAAFLAAASARTVLGELAKRAGASSDYVTAEAFKGWLNEIQAATGIKGKELYNPVRIALTGFHSGREFDKLIPLIEDGAALDLPIRGVRDRIAQFAKFIGV